MNLACLEKFTSTFVTRILPHANGAYVRQNWPVVYMALDERGLDYESMILMALATIAAEAGDFNICVREYVSRWNTSDEGRGGGKFFDLYDGRADLGNRGEPDGWKYRGGGAVQLTGRYNYAAAGKALGIPLEEKPELIEHPVVSARALAYYLGSKKDAIDEALAKRDYKKARRLVNGGSHGLDAFQAAYARGMRLSGKD